MPTTRSQANRPVAIATPLGDDVLLFVRMTAREQMSRPFEFEVDLLSENEGVKPEDLLGQNVTIRLELQDGGDRFWNGHVAEFRQVGALANSEVKLFRYAASVRPWLWFLTRTSDCRIFQDLTAIDIVKKVFGDLGFSQFKTSLSAEGRKREYCVQYRETDFDFVSRLLEEEGIGYYFTHEDGKHTLVLSDSTNGHGPVPGHENIRFDPSVETRTSEERIFSWQTATRLQAGAYATYDYDFEKPDVSLLAKAEKEQSFAAKLKLFDYSGQYRTPADGNTRAKIRLEELHTDFEVWSGSCDVRGLATGYLFTLQDHFRDAQNQQYLVIGAVHEVESDDFGSGADKKPLYRSTFSAISSKVQYRPPRITPPGRVHGPQTAVVVGRSGDEICTDKHGRIKVQFRWDRYGKVDENSSCWVRVAQAWAGKGWGALYLPRVGSEVLVDFLEGDPDQPIVTGQVYNGRNTPPYPLPGNMTMSVLKSSSSTGGSGFNEIRLEDKAGEEQILMHAQKDLHLLVENDRHEKVGNDRHLVVTHDKFEKIDHDSNEEVAGKKSVTITGQLSLTVKADVAEKFDGKHSEITAGDVYVKGANVVIEAGTNLTLKVGGSSVVIEAGGITITTSGPLELQGATGKFKSDGPLDIEGALTTVKSSGITAVKGAAVQIN